MLCKQANAIQQSHSSRIFNDSTGASQHTFDALLVLYRPPLDAQASAVTGTTYRKPYFLKHIKQGVCTALPNLMQPKPMQSLQSHLDPVDAVALSMCLLGHQECVDRDAAVI